MDAAHPPSKVRLVVIEPFVPEGQDERVLRALGPAVGHEPTWQFEADSALGWKGAMTRRLLLMPRHGAWDDLDADGLIVSGCLDFDDEAAEYCGVIAEIYPVSA